MRSQYITWHDWELLQYTLIHMHLIFTLYKGIFILCRDQNGPSVMLVSDYSHWLRRQYHVNLAFWPVCSSNCRGLMALLFVQHKNNMFLKSLDLLTFLYDACDDPAISQLYKRNKIVCTFILRVESRPLEPFMKKCTVLYKESVPTAQ